MIVCVCHRVNEKEIRNVASEFELKSLEELQTAIEICQTCRKCEHCVRSILDEENTCCG
jgi:bacterioferritin-associated ferredoxin